MRFAKSASFWPCERVCPWREGDEAYRTAECAQLPIEDANHTVFRWVEDQVVQFVVSVNDSRTGLRLIWEVLGIPLHEFFEIGNLPNGFFSLNVHNPRLRE